MTQLCENWDLDAQTDMTIENNFDLSDTVEQQ